MRGFVVVLVLCALFVAQFAASTAPVAAATAVNQAVSGNSETGKTAVLTEPDDTCCLNKLLKRLSRTGPCKPDGTYLPALSNIQFAKPLAVYAMTEPQHAALPENHKLLLPPIA